ncbi:hypothetical protein JWS13_39090 [Rhodococcus pseudokoreensis]|uniref:Uncharacterized protein n=1 Tax=Rhodococcus pseudokoreensis TaxID=2811421 RepID=A0A974WA82_9NOCA|nr:hypothetical protein [Rhodococcus pseudokoreensis]QSE94183.1 hypothetical protein JWS13_39090 [Rhodococcus pseudokoreensis]
MRANDKALRGHLADALGGQEHEQPPHPTDDTPEVRALARGLAGLAFGDTAAPLNFNTITEYYQPLAQSILNYQGGWIIDPSVRLWKRSPDVD